MQTQNYTTDPMLDDAASARLDQAATAVHDTVDRVHRKASELTDRVSTDGERMYAQACHWIAEHPMQAVAYAVLTGYLFGRLRH
jgi:ElaB/YqjD/DUF883 family membrane-anchored ribosome-binding protein